MVIKMYWPVLYKKVCMHTCTHTHTHTNTHKYTHACAHAHIHTHTCMHTCTHKHAHTCTHTSEHALTPTQKYIGTLAVTVSPQTTMLALFPGISVHTLSQLDTKCITLFHLPYIFICLS